MQTAGQFSCREPTPPTSAPDLDREPEPRGAMSYDALLQSIVVLDREAQGRAALAVNRWLILRNWLIGAYVVEFEQKGQDRARYGTRLLQQLARDLKRQSVAGASAEMLARMRHFYRAFPQLGTQIPSSLMTELPRMRASDILPQVPSSPSMTSGSEMPSPLSAEDVLRLSWTHWIELLQLEDPWKRAFYENECLKGSWSVRQLQRQIGSLLYERTGLSRKRLVRLSKNLKVRPLHH